MKKMENNVEEKIGSILQESYEEVQREIRKENKVTTTFKPPFTIVTYEKEGKQKHFIAVGKVRAAEEYDTYEECEQQIEGINWQLVTMLIEAYNIYLNKKNSK